jgi:hypothetical protein
MMELIERYLQAIRRQLPTGKADDITAELRDDLLSRQEEREAALGRTLSVDEVRQLIRDFGHPLIVASRYRRHQYLIGPGVYPFYLTTLRIVLLGVAAFMVIAAVVQMLLGGQPPIPAVLTLVANLFLWGLVALGSVTFVFATLERHSAEFSQSKQWSPDHLPDVGEERPGKWEGPIEVALTIVFILWWVGLIRLPQAAVGADFRLVAALIWTQLYWPILALMSVRLVHNAIQWLRPRWKLVRGLLGAATAIGALALLPAIWMAGEWITVVSTGMPADGVRSLQESLDLALRMAIVAVGIVWTLACLGELYRLAQGFRSRVALAEG